MMALSTHHWAPEEDLGEMSKDTGCDIYVGPDSQPCNGSCWLLRATAALNFVPGFTCVLVPAFHRKNKVLELEKNSKSLIEIDASLTHDMLAMTSVFLL